MITLWLDTWADGGCPILYFSVEYREWRLSDWLLASANVQPSERVFSIAELRAATRYALRVTAYNNAGSTQAFYNVTMAQQGGEFFAPKTQLPPDINTRTTQILVSGVTDEPAPNEHLAHVPFYANVAVIVSVLIALIFLLALFVVSWFLVLRKSKCSTLNFQRFDPFNIVSWSSHFLNKPFIHSKSSVNFFLILI